MTDSPLPEILAAGAFALEYTHGRLDELTIEEIADAVGRAVLHAAAEKIRALDGWDPSNGWSGYEEGQRIAADYIDPEGPKPQGGPRWHPIADCPDETTCPIHGRNENVEPAGLEDGVAAPAMQASEPRGES